MRARLTASCEVDGPKTVGHSEQMAKMSFQDSSNSSAAVPDGSVKPMSSRAVTNMGLTVVTRNSHLSEDNHGLSNNGNEGGDEGMLHWLLLTTGGTTVLLPLGLPAGSVIDISALKRDDYQ